MAIANEGLNSIWEKIRYGGKILTVWLEKKIDALGAVIAKGGRRGRAGSIVKLLIAILVIIQH
ncbi:hypothetical protein GCM10028817_14580 [Spirosoma pomorum]